MKKAAVVIGIVLAVLAVVEIGVIIAGGLCMRAQGGFGPHMMMGWWGHPRGMGLFGGGLGMLLLFGLLAGAAVLLVVGLVGGKPKGPFDMRNHVLAAADYPPGLVREPCFCFMDHFFGARVCSVSSPDLGRVHRDQEWFSENML